MLRRRCVSIAVLATLALTVAAGCTGISQIFAEAAKGVQRFRGLIAAEVAGLVVSVTGMYFMVSSMGFRGAAIAVLIGRAMMC